MGHAPPRGDETTLWEDLVRALAAYRRWLDREPVSWGTLWKPLLSLAVIGVVAFAPLLVDAPLWLPMVVFCLACGLMQMTECLTEPTPRARRLPSPERAERWFNRRVAKVPRHVDLMERLPELELELDYRLGLKQRPESVMAPPVRTRLVPMGPPPPPPPRRPSDSRQSARPVGEFRAVAEQIIRRPRPADVIVGPMRVMELGQYPPLPGRPVHEPVPMDAACARCGKRYGEHSPFGEWMGACGGFRVQTPESPEAYGPLPTDEVPE